MEAKQTFTADDGTKYEVQDDGTLRDVDGRHRKMSMINNGDSRDDRPLTWSEQRDRVQTIEAIGEVPEELRRLWSDLSGNQHAAIRFIERESIDLPESTPGHRPLWVGAALKPKGAVRSVRPRVLYRGVQLDPMVVWGADDRRIYNDPRFPWGCVCRIETAGGPGSGVLVGPRHVLTASHMIDWNSGVASIEVHRAGGMVLATARAETTLSFSRVIDNDSTSLDEDYAVIVCDQRLGDRFGWMGTRTYNSAWDGEDY